MVHRLPRIVCLSEPKHVSPTLYSLFRHIDGKYVRVAGTSYYDAGLAATVYAERVSNDLTLSIREVRKIELMEAGIKWKASWNMKSECKWLLS